MKEYIFGEIVFVGEGSQINPRMTPSAIVRKIEDKWLIGGSQLERETIAEQIMMDNHYEAYLCLETYNGRVIMMDEDGTRKFAIPAPRAS